MYKKCGQCKIFKLITEFHKKQTHSSGVQYKCKLCANICRRARYQQERTSPHVRFNYSQNEARRRHHAWELTYPEYVKLISQMCFYCNGSLPETSTGLDRKANTEGYTIENAVPCCTACNRIKGEVLTAAEMKAVALLLITLRKGV